ncbi:5-formyltetrahydrofolate cyclo-ligase [soil metagenome]
MTAAAALDQEKRQARTEAQRIRDSARKTIGESAALALAENALCFFAGSEPAVVSGFHPHMSEISVLPLLARLVSMGWASCLPAVTGKGHPLVFRAWEPGDALIRGLWDIKVPAEDAKELVPDMLLVPMLAFDRQGHRLGYGGGFYDRTLELLRKTKPVTAIGVAYAAQEMERVPHGAHDAVLDAILTEAGSVTILKN